MTTVNALPRGVLRCWPICNQRVTGSSGNDVPQLGIDLARIPRDESSTVWMIAQPLPSVPLPASATAFCPETESTPFRQLRGGNS